MSLRSRVLSLYRRVLREVHRWPVEEERGALRTEAETLFRQNAALTDAAQIEERVFEGTTRLELSLHYGKASPRLYYMQKGTRDHDAESVAETFQVGAYMKSYGFKKKN